MKKKIFLINIAIILIILLGTASYAAVSIVPGTDVMVSISATNAYLSCRNMKNTGESLYGTTVEPHLTTNADWGAVSYLSNSAYGTNTAGGNTGIIVNINDVDYYSTNGNITGVMNWGSNPKKTMRTQVSCLSKAYMDSENNYSSVLELKKMAEENSRFVEIMGVVSSEGRAIDETRGLHGSILGYSSGFNYIPTGVRIGLFGGQISNGFGNDDLCKGNARTDTSFRPVIWNK